MRADYPEAAASPFNCAVREEDEVTDVFGSIDYGGAEAEFIYLEHIPLVSPVGLIKGYITELS